MSDCKHEWRTLQGWETECNNCGLTLMMALRLSEKKNTDLQAANAVLVGALEDIRGEVVCGNCDNYYVRAGDDYEKPSEFCELNPCVEGNGNGYCDKWKSGSIESKLAHKALSTTPTEAGERVRGMMEALEKIAQFRDFTPMNC